MGGPCATTVAAVGNDLIAGGFDGIERWDGTEWHSMGSASRG
jgi:hypothetical protein